MRSTGSFTVLLLAVASTACHRGGKPEVGPDEPHGIAELQSRAATQAAPAPAAPPAPRCGDDAWTTYGHDAARTSASSGCLFAPLRASWAFSPRWVKGTPSHATRAVVAGSAVYVTGGIGPTPTVWKLDAATGAIGWTYITMADATRDGWPTIAGAGAGAGGTLALVDDGVYSIDAQTGKGHRGELDAWGECLTDGERIYAENDRYWDGYGLSVSAFDLGAHKLWRRDYQALIRFFTAPDVGGVALDAGKLVHAAQHGPLKTTGLSAFDPASSDRIWRVEVSPQSSPSIAGGRVFGLERRSGETTDRLAARSLSDGTEVWSRELPDARGPAPVLAAGLVIVHARDGVHAFDRTSGEPRWSAPLPRTADAVQSATTLAAATGSDTLVVLSHGEVHVLQLDSGIESWSFEPAPHAKRLEGPVVAAGALYLLVDGSLMRFEGAPTDAN